MTKQSMRHLLCIALFLLYCTFGCFAAVVQQLPRKGKSALQTYTVSTDGDDKEWHPIRIGVYTKLVEDVMKYCEKKKGLEEYDQREKKYEDLLDDEIPYEVAEDLAELFSEELGLLKKLCDDKVNTMTDEKKKILFKEVLPKAIKLHADRLKVKQVEGNKNIQSESVKKNIQTGCYFFKDPLKQNVLQSSDFDFMIFASLSARPTSVEICSQDNEKRPTSAVIRFIPSEIKATRQYIRLTAHEIAHGLGFQHDLMSELKMIETRDNDLPRKRIQRIGRKFYMVKSEKTVEMLKKHYNCEQDGNVKGLYLENEGDVDNSSHWERRIAKDELMSTYSNSMGVTGMYYTNLTLSAFHDMSFYRAVFEKAEPMSWGNKSGCELLEGVKDLKQTDVGVLFCKDDDKVALQCTSDRFALGVCSTNNKPNEKLLKGYHYFTDEDGNPENDLMDDYPIIKPLKGTFCEGGNETLLPGSILSNMSRCLNLNKPLIKKGNIGNGMEVHGICAKVKCDNNEVSVLKGYDGNEEKWHDCEKDGDEIKLEGSVFNGETVKCPKYEEVCIGLLEAESTKIKFYNGKEFTEGYVDPTEAKATQEEPEAAKGPNPPHTLEVPSVEHQISSPVSQNDGKDQQISAHPVSPESRIESGGGNTDNNGAVGSGGNSGSNEDQKSVAQSQRSESVVNGVLTGQSSPSSAPRVVAPADPSSAISNDNTHGTLKGQEDHLKLTDTNLNDHSKRDGSTPSVSSQHTDSLTESRVQQNEMQTPPQLSKDHEQTPNQDQSPNEVESQKADKVETEVSSASSSSINVTPTAASPSTEVSSIPTNVAPTGETAQPEKSETTNNTSPSTDVHERNNASITEKEPITDVKNKGSAANKVEDLANQLVTIGEKNADSSITTSYMVSLVVFVCVVGFVMIP